MGRKGDKGDRGRDGLPGIKAWKINETEVTTKCSLFKAFQPDLKNKTHGIQKQSISCSLAAKNLNRDRSSRFSLDFKQPTAFCVIIIANYEESNLDCMFFILFSCRHISDDKPSK